MSFFSDVVEYLKTTIDETIGVESVDRISYENVDEILGEVFGSVIHLKSIRDLKGNVLVNYSAQDGEDKKKFRAWMITRTNFSPVEQGGTLFFREHTFALYPYYAHDGMLGESEMVFQDHIERVAGLFDGDIYLGNHVLTSSPISTTEIGHRQWLDTLCHSATLTFTASQDRRY